MSDDWQVQQEKLWRWADKYVVPWGKLQADDYDFSSWAKDENLLNAGCLYEYARESYKFRCRLVLHIKPKPKELSATLPLTEFKGSSAGPEYLLKSGWERWLDNFANELIANKSFAELIRTDRAKVQQSLSALPSYSLFPKAVESPGRRINYPGSQIVEVQIFWRHYTDNDIGEEMKKLATRLRPSEWKGPRRRGKGKATSVIALLDGLSAMRLASHYPKTLPRKLVWRHKEKYPTGTDTAVAIFDEIRLGRIQPGSIKRKIHGELGHNEFDRCAARARSQFARWFPFGEAAANSVTSAKRRGGQSVV